MDVSITLPLDSEGFIRANEEAEAHADPSTYYCPLCGEPSGPDKWWTQEQLEYVQGAALPGVMQTVQDELVAAFRGSKSIKFETGNSGDTPDVPASLVEPDDMFIVASPCHAYEPVKVPDVSGPSFHCLLCGQAFAV